MGIAGKRVTLQNVVNTIYDAALDSDQWPDAVLRANAYCGSEYGNLLWYAVDRGQPVFLHSNVPAAIASDYATRYAESDPATQFSVTAPVDTANINAQFMPRSRFRGSDMFRDIMRPIGVEDRAGIIVLRDANNVVVFSVCRTRHEDPYELNGSHQLKHLSRHFRRAVQISNRLLRTENRAESLAAVLNQMHDGAFLLDEHCRVVFMNAAAERLVAVGMVTLRAGTLRAPNPADAPVLAALLERAVATGQGEDVDPGGSLVLHAGDGSHCGTVAAMPLRASAAGEEFGAHPIRAVVFTRERGKLETPSPALLRALYGLTAAEARLAWELMQGHTLLEVADQLRVTEATLRAHLQAIFHKTKVRRQSDLVRLLLDLPAVRKLPSSN
jgi:DNA-binding CsgD family transcriptional regulator